MPHTPLTNSGKEKPENKVHQIGLALDKNDVEFLIACVNYTFKMAKFFQPVNITQFQDLLDRLNKVSEKLL